MKEAAPSKPPLRELSPLPPTVYIHVCVGIGQEGGSGESTFRGWRIEKTNTGLLLFAGCPVFRYSKRPANMTEAFCRITICPDKSKSHAYPGRGFPGAGSVPALLMPVRKNGSLCRGKFSEEGGSEGGRLFQEVPSLRGLSFPFPSEKSAAGLDNSRRM